MTIDGNSWLLWPQNGHSGFKTVLLFPRQIPQWVTTRFTCEHLSPGADVKWIHRPEVKTSPQQTLTPAPAHVEMDQGAIWQSTTCKKGWCVSLASIINANWKASHGNVWTVPYGGGVGRIMKLGFQPVALAAQFYGNAVHPANTPAWTMRLQISFLFPKLTKEQQEMLMEKKLKQFEQEPQ